MGATNRNCRWWLTCGARVPAAHAFRAESESHAVPLNRPLRGSRLNLTAAENVCRFPSRHAATCHASVCVWCCSAPAFTLSGSLRLRVRDIKNTSNAHSGRCSLHQNSFPALMWALHVSDPCLRAMAAYHDCASCQRSGPALRVCAPRGRHTKGTSKAHQTTSNAPHQTHYIKSCPPHHIKSCPPLPPRPHQSHIKRRHERTRHFDVDTWRGR